MLGRPALACVRCLRGSQVANGLVDFKRTARDVGEPSPATSCVS